MSKSDDDFGLLSSRLAVYLTAAMIPRIGVPRKGVGEVSLDRLHPLHPVPRPGVPPGHILNLVSSIQANGHDLTQPFPVVRMPDGRLVQLGGHHRAEAMRQLGEVTIPARVVDWNCLAAAVRRWWQQRLSNFPWDDFLR